MEKENRLRDLREDRDLTQKQLAEIMYMHVTQYRRYESGERALSLDLAAQLARFYNVSLDYLAGLEPYNAKLREDGLSAEEKHLLTNYRRLNKKNKDRIDERLQTLLSLQNEK